MKRKPKEITLAQRTKMKNKCPYHMVEHFFEKQEGKAKQFKRRSSFYRAEKVKALKGDYEAMVNLGLARRSNSFRLLPYDKVSLLLEKASSESADRAIVHLAHRLVGYFIFFAPCDTVEKHHKKKGDSFAREISRSKTVE